MPTCLLVRHGRTTANASGVLAGWTPDVHLDERGQAQAHAVGERMRAAGLQPVRVVTSPLTRCQETSAELLQALGDELSGAITPRQDERLGECRYGAWTGRPLKELAKEPLWRIVQDQPSAARFPDGEDYPGESVAAMQARALAALREMDAEVRQEHGEHAVWVAVSHGDVIKSLLADAAGAHLDAFQRFHVDPASVSVIRYTERRPFLLRSNDTGSDLSDLRPPEPGTEQPPADGGSADGGPDNDADPETDLRGDAVVGGGAG